ncbi:Septum formation protein Maf [Acidisarcina polymorpha]|uniref:dTTP/UTP pyrophosphatase n=1 Tax=Acidisarcina polymorpha TaxID=2211140 RepID=A0A2Z5G271_9BACT|nr:Maf family protein [Acidisarcina polymorpha]AXC13201.1 Septum formation protein Maf [Acidisarcina polymorpha]
MLVLASASPRRKELLTQAGFKFQVVPSSIAEVRRAEEDAASFAVRLAREKAQSVFDQIVSSRVPDQLLVLGADTIVVTPEEILGKPHGAADAARMLRLLSGRTHLVMTGVCLVSDHATEVAVETTAVAFQTLSEDDIARYIATGEPMDKAGGYAIQGYAARWIPHIRGCYFNVVGLPIALVSNMIEGENRRTAALVATVAEAD